MSPGLRVIFLDIDGVLNCRSFVEGLGATEWDKMIDRRAVARLDLLVRRSSAEIVISSSWRCHLPIERIEAILQDHGFDGKILGITPRRTSSRAAEIQAWLDAADEAPAAVVILDDLPEMDHLAPYFVQTTWEEGLLDVHVERALTLLGVTR